MGRSRTYNIMGYGEAIRGSRRVFTAMSLLEAYQETVKAEREGVRIVEWTYQTEVGRRMLGLNPMSYYRRAQDMARPQGLVRCPRCAGKGCQICAWCGETMARVLRRYRPWQLEPIKEAVCRK
jgi:hypothetical protein